MAIYPAQPQSIGAVLDTTFQLYKASVVRVLALSLLMVIASLPPSIYMLMHVGTNPAEMIAGAGMLRDPTYWALYVASILGTLCTLGALYLKIGAIGTDEDVSVGEALQGGLRKMLPLFLLSILFMLAVVIGFVLLIIPGLILVVSLMLSVNLAIYENKGPVQSLRESHRLVWGNWWRTAAILTIGFTIVLVIYLIAGVVAGVLFAFAGLAGDGLLFTTLVGVVVGGLMNLLVTPFYISLVIAVYWDLKLRKEGGDLAARVGALNPA
jgi:hypothetical protein